ncbi:MAG: glycosyltransferase family 4 protein [Cyclobacteriaceae bacterium]|nr:glycosyltransferase family 4 protein [Cyclobacteriaceae bacterium]
MNLSKQILFICPYPHGLSPSQRFRFEQYFQLLKDNNYRIDVQSFWSTKAWNILYRNGYFFSKFLALSSGFIRRFFLLFSVPRYDFIFIHREVAPIGPPVFEWIIAKVFRKKIIFDFDDAIWIANTSRQNNIVEKLKFHQKVGLVCTWSSVVSCGNEFLQQFALQYNSKSRVNPTTIDTQNFHIPYSKFHNPHVITIGWTGSHSTLQYLKLIEGPLKKILATHINRVCFLVIADQQPMLDFPFQFIRWKKETEIEDLQKIDIGIMPLTDDIWAQGKCGFKALQYMSLEIPVIASPVGVNKSIVDHLVTGILCSEPEEWVNQIEFIIQHPELRIAIGKAGRIKVDKFYSLASNSSNFLTLFE